MWQKKKSGEVLVQQQIITLSQTGEINANNDSISDLVRKVKGKCEIEMFGRKMFSVVIMFCGESVKMYKYAKSAECGESVIIGDKRL